MRYEEPSPRPGSDPVPSDLPVVPPAATAPVARTPLRVRMGSIATGIVAAIVAVFALQNLETVTLEFVTFTATVRIAWVIAGAVAVGFVVGWLVGRPSRADRRRLRGR